jgi:hypothetical protein
VHGVLDIPELADLEIGADAGQWPGTVEQWEGVALAVLVGAIPDALAPSDSSEAPESPDAWSALAAAVDAGLRVVILEAADAPPGRSWARRLGLSPAAAGAAVRPTVPDGSWGDLYRLGVDRDESARRWSALPATPVRTLDVSSGVPLLLAGDRASVALVPRGEGVVVYCGLPLHAWRRGDARAVANRWLRGLLALALEPTPVDGAMAARRADPALSRAAFELTPQAAPLETLAASTGGRFVELSAIAGLEPDLQSLAPRVTRRVTVLRLWHGWWFLPMLLLLVSAEYLLRRRAGTVM